jgi:D-alanyl-D-alanine carboxypeptidase (penicillin-binding protein 5/6)
MAETQQRTDDLSAFAELLDGAPAATGSGRAARTALLVVLVSILLVLAGGGGYVWWVSATPLPAPTLTTQLPTAAAGEAATVRLPADGAMRVSVTGGEQYLGADTDGAWAASGGDDPRPIASVAKLITALVVLDRHPLNDADDPGPTVAFTEADTDLYDQFYVRGATIARMPDGLRLSLHDSLATMLLPSASNYAVAIARWGFGSESAYVDAARAWLDANGLSSTRVGGGPPPRPPHQPSPGGGLPGPRPPPTATPRPRATSWPSERSRRRIPPSPRSCRCPPSPSRTGPER